MGNQCRTYGVRCTDANVVLEAEGLPVVVRHNS
ncbi:hypothetical protein ES288_A04G084100v1 [Gossypium darwinii]|uniref:Uncharacterized protein n=1 Tax=Gossypium darwinii TaxID=34276 RepID=A0A5D2GUR1_GOSDA|nr:hypothetical protein ES288_A04G084100v1 [Gossypium darwinii]